MFVLVFLSDFGVYIDGVGFKGLIWWAFFFFFCWWVVDNSGCCCHCGGGFVLGFCFYGGLWLSR